tara:strand:- start:14297 stop:14617 length:321 start_codon:yes stop_codon:yes gene_type:complete
MGISKLDYIKSIPHVEYFEVDISHRYLNDEKSKIFKFDNLDNAIEFAKYNAKNSCNGVIDTKLGGTCIITLFQCLKYKRHYKKITRNKKFKTMEEKIIVTGWHYNL